MGSFYKLEKARKHLLVPRDENAALWACLLHKTHLLNNQRHIVMKSLKHVLHF